jgi:integrase
MASQWIEADTVAIRRALRLVKITTPKHESKRTVAMTAPVRDRLLVLARESEWVFTTVRGTHYTPSSRNLHWNRVRASVGIGNVSLYLATWHFFGWYALNVLDMTPHEIALQLGHDDGGELVRTLLVGPHEHVRRLLGQRVGHSEQLRLLMRCRAARAAR